MLHYTGLLFVLNFQLQHFMNVFDIQNWTFYISFRQFMYGTIYIGTDSHTTLKYHF